MRTRFLQVSSRLLVVGALATIACQSNENGGGTSTERNGGTSGGGGTRGAGGAPAASTGGTGSGTSASGGSESSAGGSSGSGGSDASVGAGGSGPADVAPSVETGSDTGGSNPMGGPPSAVPATGLGPWTGNDNVPPSRNPPGNFPVDKVPLFVSLGFDDNPENDGMRWAVSAFNALKNPAGSGQAATHDGAVTKATFYHTSVYVAAAPSWKEAYLAGFETGNHTINHFHGGQVSNGMNFNEAGWTREIDGCNQFLTSAAVGVKKADIVGFRTPFLQYNGPLFPALKALGFHYDCSIAEGHQPEMDGTNHYWPYTLDGGSPGHATNPRQLPINSWPKGLWELPAYRVITPPDDLAAMYGITPGLRARQAKLKPGMPPEFTERITGLDYDMWYDAKLTKAEFVATLKYTLDLRRKGNRAPFLFGMHSAIYTAATPAGPVASLAERRAAIVEFLQYALTFPEVRVVTMKAVLDWVRNPVPLR